MTAGRHGGPRRLAVGATTALVLGATIVAGCGGAGAPSAGNAARRPGRHARHASAHARPRSMPIPRLLPAATSTGATAFVPAVSLGGRTAVYVARSSSVTLLSFDQRLVSVHLHSGTVDAGPSGWRWGAAVSGSERRRLIAGFNGGFKLDVGAGGFFSYGRTAAALGNGLGSIVTYANGTTDIGAWRQGVPATGQRVLSVRQNLHLLISGGRPAPDLGCLLCWGATLGGTSTPARSALGVTSDGHLVWAAGPNLTVAALADALLAARVVRAVELDINPEWVAGYLYAHRGRRGALVPVPVSAGQSGIPGQLLAPDSRDFFTVVTRG